MADLHFAVTRRVRPGYEAEFEANLLDFARSSMRVEGMAGVHILRPAPDSPTREYGILRSFESQSFADAFYESELFSNWQKAIADFVEGEPHRRQLSGLEAFFRSGKGVMPPRWKMAIVTFLGVLPSVLLWSNIIPPLLAGTHWLLTAAAVNVAVVCTLTWGVMPLLTKWFHSWLHAGLSEPVLATTDKPTSI